MRKPLGYWRKVGNMVIRELDLARRVVGIISVLLILFPLSRLVIVFEGNFEWFSEWSSLIGGVMLFYLAFIHGTYRVYDAVCKECENKQQIIDKCNDEAETRKKQKEELEIEKLKSEVMSIEKVQMIEPR